MTLQKVSVSTIMGVTVHIAVSVSTVVEHPLVVWEAGTTGHFTLDLELTYPVLTVT